MHDGHSGYGGVGGYGWCLAKEGDGGAAVMVSIDSVYGRTKEMVVVLCVLLKIKINILTVKKY